MLGYVQAMPLLAALSAGFFMVLLGCVHPGFRRVLRRQLDHPRPPSSGNTLLALDSLRGIAILLVVSFHLFQWFNPGFGALGAVPLVRNGWSGVELFVVLSGYLIYGAVKSGGISREALKKYAKRRFFRIYPVYFVTALIGIALILHGPTPFAWHGNSVKALVSWADQIKMVGYEVFLLRGANWFLEEILNPPAWSLGAELSFYIFVPVYVWWTRNSPLKSAIGAFLVLFLLKNHGPREFSIFVFFWVGILLYEVEKSSLLDRLSATHIWVLFGVGVASVLFFMLGNWVDMQGHHLFSRGHKTGYLVLGFFLMLIAILKHPGIAAWFSWYPLRLVGIISYSVFLWHFALYAVAGLESFRALALADAMFIFMMLVLPSCLFISGLSYVTIERPFLRRRF